MGLQHKRGFTLLELLVTVAIVGILVSIAGPSFVDFLDRKRLAKAAEQIASHLQFVRTESLSRQQDLHISGNANGSANWIYGVGLGDGDDGADCDVTITNPVTAGACVLVVDDGDGNVHGTDPDGDGTPVTDTGDLVLYRYSSADHPNIKLAVLSGAPPGGATRN